MLLNHSRYSDKTCNWYEDFEFSKERIERDKSIIMNNVPHCEEVYKTNKEIDKKGADYIAKLQSGNLMYIDAKNRRKGASKYWKNGEPELVLEIWSDIAKKVPGWTWKKDALADHILFTFYPEDSEKSYFFPTYELRNAFRKNGKKWAAEYGVHTNESEGANGYRWKSMYIFVPANIVSAAINKEFVWICRAHGAQMMVTLKRFKSFMTPKHKYRRSNITPSIITAAPISRQIIITAAPIKHKHRRSKLKIKI